METKDFVKSRLAPCGLHCGRCFAFAGGDIHRASRELRAALGNFAPYAERFVEQLGEPAFGKYPDFRLFLDYLATASCRGCRTEKCKFFLNCRVRDCSRAHGVDFCCECPEFPCRGTGFDDHLYERYVRINRRIADIGSERYYEEVKERPRY